jgi:hypothetical protein
MTQRPKPLIGHAIVIALLLLFGKPDTAKGVERIVGRYLHMIVGIDRLPVGIARPVGHPDATTGSNDGIQSRHHPAGRLDTFDLSALESMDIRLTICNDDELALSESSIKDGLE